MKAGDILVVRGRSWISRAIRKLTRSPGEEPTRVSHVGLAVDSQWIIEALGSGVKLRRYSRGQLYRPVNIPKDELELIVAKALSYRDKKYGFLKIGLHALDGLLGGVYLFRRLAFIDGAPICSWVVASSYAAAGYTFGVDARAASPDDIHDFVSNRPGRFRLVL